jgi:hypothetical protein
MVKEKPSVVAASSAESKVNGSSIGWPLRFVISVEYA